MELIEMENIIELTSHTSIQKQLTFRENVPISATYFEIHKNKAQEWIYVWWTKYRKLSLDGKETGICYKTLLTFLYAWKFL